MRGPGIVWMIETAIGLSLAGPLFIVGVEFVRTGQYVVGVGFFVFAAFALFFPTYLRRRIGGPRTWIRRRLGDDSERERSSVLDRFRRE